MRLPITIPPGLRRDGTEGQSRGRWMRGNLARAYGADVGPVGGWRARSSNTVSGKARALIAWTTDGQERRIAIGTHTGLYVQNAGGSVFAITPAAFTAGGADATVNTGFGGGAYGANAYGTPRIDTGSPEPATVWRLETWGQYLMACCPSDGRVVMWQNNTAVAAAVVTNAPTACLGVLTTQERFVVALGASGNPRKVMWSDRGVETTWSPSSTNLAGDFELDSNGSYVAAVELRGLSLILTDQDAHSMVYVGLPFVYVFNRVGDGCGAISPGCVATQGDFAMWWSKSGFVRFDGAITPVECPIEDLRTAFNTAQQSKITAFHNADHSEFWWLYPSSASNEIDRYIAFNYLTGEWWEGELTRLAGIGPGVYQFPLLIGSDGKVYEHEVGADWDSAAPYVRSGPIKLGDGVPVMRVKGGEFDFVGSATVQFFNRDYPTSTENQSVTTTLAAGKTDLRFSGRQTEIRVDFLSSDARFGQFVLNMSPGGLR